MLQFDMVNHQHRFGSKIKRIKLKQTRFKPLQVDDSEHRTLCSLSVRCLIINVVSDGELRHVNNNNHLKLNISKIKDLAVVDKASDRHVACEKKDVDGARKTYSISSLEVGSQH